MGIREKPNKIIIEKKKSDRILLSDFLRKKGRNANRIKKGVIRYMKKSVRKGINVCKYVPENQVERDPAPAKCSVAAKEPNG